MKHLQSSFRIALALVLAAPMLPVGADHAPEHAVSSPAARGPLDALKALGISALGGSAEPEFLDPEVAYVLSAEIRDPETIVARWDIAEGYYLYRDKFRFALADATVGQLGAARLPPGKVKDDPYFGRQEVYYEQVEAIIPLQRVDPAPAALALDIGYQGCADAGLCYPPITKRVTLALPAAAASAGPGAQSWSQATAPAESAGALAEQDRIARALAAGAGWPVLAAFFGFGLLLTFTPCVFPMIPILSSIIVGQGDTVDTRRAFALSLTYVLAMSFAYTAAGVAAGLFGAGANLQAAFQDPWILSAFIVVFVLLALSMFGFYDLQIPVRWQTKLARISNRQQRGTYIGVAVMGVLSALIVGPCVAAPLAGALIYIGQTGDALLGGMALFALSLGMGTPVLVAGTSGGRLLPRAGPWMKSIKAVFGVALLGVAIYLLERIVQERVTMLLWAALLIVSAVYMGALDSLTADTSGWRRLWKGAGLVMAVYGIVLIVGAARGGGDLFRPLMSLGSSESRAHVALDFEPVKGPDGLRRKLRSATDSGKPVMLDFYADWCVSCKELERYTFSDPGVQAALAGAALLRADVTANDAADKALLDALGLFGPPAILFFDARGVERREFRVVGFIEARPFEAHVRRALAEEQQKITISGEL